MRRLALGLGCALCVMAAAAGAAAQERLDSSIRAWGDIAFYSGDVGLEGSDLTAITPVLRAEPSASSATAPICGACA
jgi:hypothetical protein